MPADSPVSQVGAGNEQSSPRRGSSVDATGRGPRSAGPRRSRLRHAEPPHACHPTTTAGMGDSGANRGHDRRRHGDRRVRLRLAQLVELRRPDKPEPGPSSTGHAELHALHAITRGVELPRRPQFPRRPRAQSILPGVQDGPDGLPASAASEGPPAAAPSAQTHTKLLRLSNCLRAHGYPSIPDPKPNPPPPAGRPRPTATARFMERATTGSGSRSPSTPTVPCSCGLRERAEPRGLGRPSAAVVLARTSPHRIALCTRRVWRLGRCREPII